MARRMVKFSAAVFERMVVDGFKSAPYVVKSGLPGDATLIGVRFDPFNDVVDMCFDCISLGEETGNEGPPAFDVVYEVTA